MQKVEFEKAIVAALAVLTLWSVFITIGYLLTIVFQLPQKLELPLPVQILGLLTILSGLLLFAWLIKYRRPMEVLISTHADFHEDGKENPVRRTIGEN